MASPSDLSHRFTRGDDYSVSVTFTDTAGAPQNISGWTNISALIRKAPDDNSVVVPFTINTSGAASGVLTFSLTSNQTRVVPQPAVWDLQRTSSGASQTVVAGMVIMEKDVTQ
jgi:hypothetical protein